MPKERMSLLDCVAMTKEVRHKLLGLRLANIYNLSENGRSFVFKFTSPVGKFFLLVESGRRFHLTSFAREKDERPSNFAMKLRKHIRTRRLEKFRQVGGDREIDMQFGTGENEYHVIFQLYASGNIMLTDKDYKILNLLRVEFTTVPSSSSVAVEDDEGKQQEEFKLEVNSVYPIEAKLQHAVETEDTDEAIAPEALIRAIMDSAKATQDKLAAFHAAEEAEQAVRAEEERRKQASGNKKGGKSNSNNKPRKTPKRKKPPKGQTVQQVMAHVLTCGPELLLHAILDSGVDTSKLKLQAPDLLSKVAPEEQTALLRTVLSHVAKTKDILSEVQQNTSMKGFIKCKRKKPDSSSSSSSSSSSAAAAVDTDLDGKDDAKPRVSADLLYDEFFATLLLQHVPASDADKELLVEFDCFSDAVDEFYSRIEVQKQDLQLQRERAAAQGKVERVKLGHERALQGFASQQEKDKRGAELIHLNIDAVDAALEAVNAELARGVNWQEIELMLRDLKAEGSSPVAKIISQLDFEKQTMHVLLSESMAFVDMSPGELKNAPESEHPISVRLDIRLSSYQNADALYSRKKAAAKKAGKTIESQEKALKQAQRKASEMTKHTDRKHQMTAMRKVHWFEKFHWFISSEGVLVIGGRDATQNEAVFKRYMDKDDLYLHANVHGSSSMVVKSNADVKQHCEPGTFPAITLSEAAVFNIARSSAWKSQVFTSAAAYWVAPDQVSKSAPSGQYLATGSFMVRGKKNFIPAGRFEMGFAVLFRLDASCVERHQGERNVRSAMSKEALAQDDGKWARTKAMLEQEDEADRAQVADLDDLTSQFVARKKKKEEKKIDAGDTNKPSVEGPRTCKCVSCFSGCHYPPGQCGREEDDYDKEQAAKKAQRVASGQSAEISKKPKKISRAKKKKLQKYAEQQDEQDRRYKAELYGIKMPSSSSSSSSSSSVLTPDVPEVQAEAEQKSSALTDAKQQETGDDSDKTCFYCKERGHRFRNCPTRAAKVDEEVEQMTMGQAMRQTQKQEKAEIAQIKKDENIMDDELRSLLGESLDVLTGRPRKDDVLLYAIPVCAPWGALKDYKYKVKLIPSGSSGTKKKKLCNQMLSNMLLHPEGTPQERELLKMLDDPSTYNVLLSNVKIQQMQKKGGNNKRRKGNGGGGSSHR